MPAQVTYIGPKPPAGEKFCFVCAYTWKLAVNDRYKDVIDAANVASDDTSVVIDGTIGPGNPIPRPAVAVAQGINGALPQFGILDLCWSHLTAIKLQTASGLALPPPGGIPGMGMPGGFGMNGQGPR